MTGRNPSPRDTIPLSHALEDRDWRRIREQGIRVRTLYNGMVVACNRIGLAGYGRNVAQALAELDAEIDADRSIRPSHHRGRRG